LEFFILPTNHSKLWKQKFEKKIQTNFKETIEDDKQWLTYWVIFGLFSIIEHFIDKLSSFIPYYWVKFQFLTQKEIKIVFLIFLQAPQTQGALLIFKKYLEPFLNKNQPEKEATENGKKIQNNEQTKLASSQSLFLFF
jgi:hypothetical protein